MRRVLAHYEAQSDIEAVAEDEAAFRNKRRTVVEVPVELMPVVRGLIGLVPGKRTRSPARKSVDARARSARGKGKAKRS